MPPLSGFSDNSFESRDDVVRATEALLRPLLQYFSPGRARVKIPVATGTHFDETAAQLEGFARPLWAVGALLMSGSPDCDLIQPWLDGFEAGVDPNHPEYWGAVEDYDQRIFETEMISFALLAAPPHVLWEKFSPKTQQNLISWLSRLNTKEIHLANWLWFRVFANLALSRVCGVDNPETESQVEADLNTLDTFYITDGWSSDGRWRSPESDDEEHESYKRTGRANAVPKGRNACFYSGSFAIQFSQLLYVRFAADRDPLRTKRYRQQAREFGACFWRFFDSEGAVVPFGRSLTYRFATAGFFAALAVAGVSDMPEPLSSPGKVKGFLLRHLRWWARNSENIFYPDGTLNLGWVYPNMYLTEDYNSPQSVYWCLKSLIVVALNADELFWTELEAPYPAETPGPVAKLLPAPRQILCNHPQGNHHFMLSTAQFIAQSFKGSQAKYCKFAYSSSFGFSVPTTQGSLQQIAPDNALVLSRDGTETWAGKYKCRDTKYNTALVRGSCPEETISATVEWYPWADRSVVLNTTVLPATRRWPDWHVRVHRLKAPNGAGRLFTAEGGFAINGRRRDDGLALPTGKEQALGDDFELGKTEYVIQDDRSTLVLSDAGASGVAAEVISGLIAATSVSALKPEANTNLMSQRTLIPLIEHNIKSLSEGEEIIFITKVFAISTRANGGLTNNGITLKQRWLDEPVFRFDGAESDGKEDFIEIHV